MPRPELVEPARPGQAGQLRQQRRLHRLEQEQRDPGDHAGRPGSGRPRRSRRRSRGAGPRASAGVDERGQHRADQQRGQAPSTARDQRASGPSRPVRAGRARRWRTATIGATPKARPYGPRRRRRRWRGPRSRRAGARPRRRVAGRRDRSGRRREHVPRARWLAQTPIRPRAKPTRAATSSSKRSSAR